MPPCALRAATAPTPALGATTSSCPSYSWGNQGTESRVLLRAVSLCDWSLFLLRTRWLEASSGVCMGIGGALTWLKPVGMF